MIEGIGLKLRDKIENDNLSMLDLWNVAKKHVMLIAACMTLSLTVVTMYFVNAPILYEGKATIGLVKNGKVLVKVVETKFLINKSIVKWKDGEVPRGFDVNLVKKIESVSVEEIPGSDSQINVSIRVSGTTEETLKIFEGLKTEMVLSDYAATYTDSLRADYTKSIEILSSNLVEAYKTKKFLFKKKIDGQKIIELEKHISKLKMDLHEAEMLLRNLKSYDYDYGPKILPYDYKPKIKLYFFIATVVALVFGLYLALVIEIRKSDLNRLEN